MAPASSIEPSGLNAPFAGRLARAKINLWLHVGAARRDRYHPIHSLMMFADLADRLDLHEGSDGPTRVTGAFGEALSGGNLVDRARSALADVFPGRVSGFRLTLEKNLPVAAGLGGGSADAAAALILMRDRLQLPASDEDLAALGASLGSDVPACLVSQPVIAEGRGERLSRAPNLPDVPAVLVNPGVPVSTAAVFRAFDESGPAGELTPLLPADFGDVAALARYLAQTRNDLELAAQRGAPEIAEALGRLGAEPETLLARMSGSGASVWAFCADPDRAERLGARVAAARPDWWVRPCTLRGAV